MGVATVIKNKDGEIQIFIRGALQVLGAGAEYIDSTTLPKGGRFQGGSTWLANFTVNSNVSGGAILDGAGGEALYGEALTAVRIHARSVTAQSIRMGAIIRLRT